MVDSSIFETSVFDPLVFVVVVAEELMFVSSVLGNTVLV